MATTTLLPPLKQRSPGDRPLGTQASLPRTAWVLLCSALAFGLLGYHPFAEIAASSSRISASAPRDWVRVSDDQRAKSRRLAGPCPVR